MKKEEQRFSIPRARILRIIHKSPKTISQIEKEIGMGRTTIYFHLNELKKRKLIIEKKETKKRGQPVFITTNKADPSSLQTISGIELMLKISDKMDGLIK